MLVEKKILSDHFEEIYVSWFSRMKYFALEYVVSEEDAENIVQDVFTELWEKKEILAYDVNLVALLFTLYFAFDKNFPAFFRQRVYHFGNDPFDILLGEYGLIE